VSGVARLLLVDDDTGTLGWMAPALESRGHVVRTFANALAALDALETWAPDLILADIVMAEMDGLTFARLARRYRGVPVMFISIASKQAEAVIAGAVGYVQKPASADEVRTAVDRILGRRAERNVILVVDDEAATRELYQAFLEPRFVVLGAENGLVALAMLAARHVDLAIVDVHMPVMNGVELIQRMRSRPDLVHLPVIVQTSDREALAAPVWRDLRVSQLIDKGDFLDWISRQIDDHVAAHKPAGASS
jgi:CheY-like chemotaxis protein